MKRAQWRQDSKRTVLVIKRYERKLCTPIHMTSKGLNKKYGLKWLRVRMIMSRHSNLKEILLGDSTKNQDGVENSLTKTRLGNCTCMRTHKPNGECLYKE